MKKSKDEKIGKKELIRRYLLFVISLFISSLGVAITKKGELGVSPISSVANILSMQFSFLSLGSWLIIWNCLLILGQILLMKRKFQLIQLLQIPLSFLFGYFTDFGMWLMSLFEVDSYIARVALVVLGTIVLALGVSLSVIANVVMNSGEAFIKALSDTLHKSFGNLKVMFDVLCVIAAVVLSLLFFNMKIEGTREGTIIAALLTGVVVKVYLKLLSKPVNKVLIG